jgi:hypothetical protein
VLQRIAIGYQHSTAIERGGFGMLAASALTIGVARGVTFIGERRRWAPWLRSVGRRVYHIPGGEQIRIHHFLPGIVISALTGATAIFARDDGREAWLGPAFGVGVGLTLDETALLMKLDNPYWGKQALVRVEAAIAATGALAMAARFAQRGSQCADRGRVG